MSLLSWYISRFSLAFLDVGNVGDGSLKRSFVHRSSIHHGYNVGVGVFGTDFLEIINTIVHHTVGPAIQINGMSHSLIGNLIAYSIAEATYEVRHFAHILFADINIKNHSSNILSNLNFCLFFLQTEAYGFDIKWPGAISAIKAKNLTLIGNSIAGSEKDGLHWQGQKCSESGFAQRMVRDNEIHSTLFGIHVPAKGSYDECVYLSGFKVS